MSGSRLHIVLATDSREPSGMGEHMLTLAASLRADFVITIAALDVPEVDMLSRAARLELGIKALSTSGDLESWLRQTDVSLLHVHAGIGWEGHELARAGLACDIPVIRTDHLPYLLTDTDQQRIYSAEVKHLSHHIVVSEASRNSYVENGLSRQRMTVVHNGIVALENILASPLKSGKTLLTVARFSKQKDHDTLIRAMPLVVRSHPDVTLLLVGQGDEKETMEKLVYQLGLEKHVQFLGQRTDVSALMAEADAFVLPSRFEGLPLA